MNNKIVLTLEEFVTTPVPKGNTFDCYIKHKDGLISAMKSGYESPLTVYNFWDESGLISIAEFSYSRETMFKPAVLADLLNRFNNAVSDKVCCSCCQKPLFYKDTYIKINNWRQVWAGFYCEDCDDGSVMDTTGD